MKKHLLATASVCALLCMSACSPSSPAPADPNQRSEASRERSVAFKTLGGDMKELGDVVQGNVAYDVEKFKAKVAEFVAHSEVPFQHMEQDANGANGLAKAEVWSNAAGFQAETEKFSQAVATLNAAAESGNLEQIKAAFGPVGGSCKSCHESFKIPNP